MDPGNQYHHHHQHIENKLCVNVKRKRNMHLSNTVRYSPPQTHQISTQLCTRPHISPPVILPNNDTVMISRLVLRTHLSVWLLELLKRRNIAIPVTIFQVILPLFQKKRPPAPYPLLLILITSWLLKNNTYSAVK